MKLEYVVSDNVFKYDHPLISQLESGELTPEKFVRKLHPTMPFSTTMDNRKGTLTIDIMSEADIAIQKQSYVQREMARLNETCGITYVHMFDEKELILKVYPEMLKSYASINIDEKRCTNCQKKDASKILIKELFAIDRAGRNINALKGKIPDMAFKRLSGEKVELTEKDIKIPASLMKQPLKLKDNPPQENPMSELKKAMQEAKTINIADRLKGKKKLILKNGQAPGDILMMTCAVRDLMKTYPGEFAVDVRTPFPQIWENNPYLTPISETDKEATQIDMNYDIIHESNEGSLHFVNGFRICLEQKLGIPIKQGIMKGDIHFSRDELSWISMIHQHFTGEDTPFWLITAGGKTDYTAKMWIPEYAQQVVDYFSEKGRQIQFVHYGAKGKGHINPKLNGVIDLLGATDIRMFLRLVYHADGVISPVSFAMHAAAAMPQKPGKPKQKACVVTAGGREPSTFTAYTNHQYLHTNGAMMCCDNGGCWKSRIVPIGDKDRKDAELCVDPVDFNGRKVQKCMRDLVTAEDVIRAIEKHYIGGALKYLPDDKQIIDKAWDDVK